MRNKKLWLLPIESLEERYTAQWAQWWPDEMRKLGVDVEVIEGERLTTRIETGQFLDVYDTHHYKATQLAAMCKRLYAGDVQAGDVVLLLDAWSPAVTALAYMRDLGVKFLLAGYLHAGTWDQWDFLAQRGLGRWAAPIETGWMRALDIILTGSEFHRELLDETRGCDPSKVTVIGCPIDHAIKEHSASWTTRERVVVFPHRLAPEKAPEEFAWIQDTYRARYGEDGTQWVRTHDGHMRSKSDYYRLLGAARVVVSCARQETFGISMVEGALLGCYPVAPNRLAYPETLGTRGAKLYDDQDLDSAVELVRAGLIATVPFQYFGYPLSDVIGSAAKALGLIE